MSLKQILIEMTKCIYIYIDIDIDIDNHPWNRIINHKEHIAYIKLYVLLCFLNAWNITKYLGVKVIHNNMYISYIPLKNGNTILCK